MLPSAALLPLLLFMTLMLTLALYGLTAAGHFPSERRAPALQSPMGRLILFGSLLLAPICLVIGLAAAWQQIPWYAAVIGGGGVVLAAPLVLQMFPDTFVDSRGALIAFALTAALLAMLLTLWF